ncbi:MAG: response regulator [Flavisolibacter sp.]
MPQTLKLFLCVEDDEDDCSWIEEAATEIDPTLEFVACPNGRDALAYLDQQKELHHLPCLILLDMNMPVMDGKQTLVALKKDPVLKEIPVVMFTTSSSKTDHLFCELWGADMVTKPGKIHELKSLIRQLVQVRCA